MHPVHVAYLQGNILQRNLIPALKEFVVQLKRLLSDWNESSGHLLRRELMLLPGGFLVIWALKYPPAVQETWVWSLVKEDPLEEGMATHPSVLAWEIPRTEESGRLQSIGSHRIRHNWATNTFTFSSSHHHNPNSLQLCWILLEALRGQSSSGERETHVVGLLCERLCAREGPQLPDSSFHRVFLLSTDFLGFSSVQFSCSVVSDSLWPHELQHARPPCPSPPGVYSNSCPSSWWCHPTISSSVIPFSSCPQSLPASGSFPMSQLVE